jgi:hypothetical protein
MTENRFPVCLHFVLSSWERSATAFVFGPVDFGPIELSFRIMTNQFHVLSSNRGLCVRHDSVAQDLLSGEIAWALFRGHKRYVPTSLFSDRLSFALGLCIFRSIFFVFRAVWALFQCYGRPTPLCLQAVEVCFRILETARSMHSLDCLQYDSKVLNSAPTFVIRPVKLRFRIENGPSQTLQDTA